MDPLVAKFHKVVGELTAPEKRSIVALTEIARDALRTSPHLAPALAAVVIERVIDAPTQIKLSVLYLLDSIAKNIGEPYKTHFAPRLPDAFSEAWIAGAPGLHRPLEKLLNTWTDIFPQPTLNAVRARLPHSAASARYTTAAKQQAYPSAAAATAADGHRPMTIDPRLTTATAPVAIPYAAPSYGGAAAYPPQYPAAVPQQQPPMHVAYPQPVAAATIASAAPIAQAPAPAAVPPMPMPDLMSLISAVTAAQGGGGGVAGAAPSAAAAASASGGAAAAGGGGGGGMKSMHRAALMDNLPTVEFNNPKTLKEHNPAAVARLMAATERTKHSFLDRIFLRRQKAESGMQSSRLWYVDLDTWMASTTTADAQHQGNGTAGGPATTAVAQAAADGPRPSVPADDEQTHCALSGERFEQYWDEELQEWRYRDAVQLDDDQAAAYGLEEGAIVLVSALGSGGGIATKSTAAATVVKSEAGDDTKVKLGDEDDADEAARAAKRIKLEQGAA